MKKIKTIFDNIGLPRLIIGLFFVGLVITSLVLGFDAGPLFSDVLRRWLMYGSWS